MILYSSTLAKLGIHLPEFLSLSGSRLSLATGAVCMLFGRPKWSSSLWLRGQHRASGATNLTQATADLLPHSAVPPAPAESHPSASLSPGLVHVYLVMKGTDFLCRSPTLSEREVGRQMQVCSCLQVPVCPCFPCFTPSFCPHAWPCWL